MGRNRLIYTLADYAIVVASDPDADGIIHSRRDGGPETHIHHFAQAKRTPWTVRIGDFQHHDVHFATDIR